MLRVEDLTNITPTEKAKLICMFDELKLPHVISETHFVISSDMQHDNAMVQKLLDDKIIPYLKVAVPSVTDLHLRSDGCKAQFKCAANFYWVSKQTAVGCGLKIDWSFFESCHGKCYCDPEGGTLKNAARLHELHVSPSDQSKQLKDSALFYKWAVEESKLATPKKALSEKKGKGIYRRFFYFIPSKGHGAVDRSRLPKLEAEGTSKLHEFIDIGVEGTVSTRRAACHQCDHCWSGERRQCVNKWFVGAPKELKINRVAVRAAAGRRIATAALNRNGLEMAEKAAVADVVCVETHEKEQSLPWVIGVVEATLSNAPAASKPFDPTTDAVQFEAVKANEPVLRVRLYEGLEPGSTTYTLSNVTLLVPARRVRVATVELQELRNARAGQARILPLCMLPLCMPPPLLPPAARRPPPSLPPLQPPRRPACRPACRPICRPICGPICGPAACRPAAQPPSRPACRPAAQPPSGDTRLPK